MGSSKEVVSQDSITEFIETVDALEAVLDDYLPSYEKKLRFHYNMLVEDDKSLSWLNQQMGTKFGHKQAVHYELLKLENDLLLKCVNTLNAQLINTRSVLKDANKTAEKLIEDMRVTEQSNIELEKKIVDLQDTANEANKVMKQAVQDANLRESEANEWAEKYKAKHNECDILEKHCDGLDLANDKLIKANVSMADSINKLISK